MPPKGIDGLTPELERDSSSASPHDDDASRTAPERTRSHSSASSSSSIAHNNDSDDWEMFLPLDQLTIFDYLDQFALPQRLEKINRTYLVQKDRVKRGFEQTKAKAIHKKDVELEKYLKKYNKNLDKLLERWDDSKVVSTREKISFVVGVSNVFITGFLIGAHP